MEDAISLLKEAEREIYRLQDAWVSTKESDALRKKIRKFIAAQQSFAADVATCSCPTFIPCHIEGKLVCADCKKPQRR